MGLLQPGYWSAELTKIVLLYIISLATGLLVVRAGVRVNYTRKINHFALFFMPIFLAPLFPHEPTLATVAVTGSIIILALSIYAEPVRTRVPLLATMFAAFDRPEDRPHSLMWLQTQIVAGYAVVLPLTVLFAQRGMPQLMLIPILINGIGDGLAEPVGVRFGKHTYKTKALNGGREYTRSLEGSACVLITGIITIVLFRESFTPAQFYVALATLPIGMTLAEAFSPHTWDTPFLFLTGGVLLMLITGLV